MLYPERGFFIGKMNKYLKVFLISGILCLYPFTIEADTAVSTLQTHDSTAPVAIQSLVSEVVPITAYTSDPAETSDHPLITASGNMVRDGIVAANFLPFGAHIQIPAIFGDKVFVVEDRMNAKFNDRVDIWMPNVKKAINFGIQHTKIVILDSSELAIK
jgi:3D (Asp-Asp-Asp) domain-containing protein